MSAALTGNSGGHFVEERQDYRNVVGSKAPENVFFRANFSNVQSVGVEIVNLSEDTVLDELLEFQDRWMIEEDMANHENPAFGLGQFHQLLAMPYIDCQRLLDQDILARFERCFRHLIVTYRRCGQGHSGYGRIAEQAGIVRAKLDALESPLVGRLDRRIRVAHCLQRAQFVEVAHEILAPIADARYSYPHARFSG